MTSPSREAARDRRIRLTVALPARAVEEHAALEPGEETDHGQPATSDLATNESG